MGWIKDVVDLCLGFARLRKERTGETEQTKRKKRHLFVLKAIALNEFPNLQHVHARRLQELAEKIFSAQMQDAGDGNLAKAAMGKLSDEEEKAFEEGFRRQQRELGLPNVRDARYEQQIETILQELVDDEKLVFIPPDKYAFPKHG